MIRRLLLLGATGDLSTRYLLPALARLRATDRLPQGFEVVGLARRDWDDEAFRRFAREHLDEHAADLPERARGELLAALHFVPGDADDREVFARALGGSGEPVLVYLALPPALFGDAVRALAEAGPPEGSRIVLEKPFGEDLGSARRLNRLLHERFPEEAVVRADHFLTEQAVHNVLALRLANRLFEAVWSGEHIERVEIRWDETLALEGRASYYDTAGALKDMIQNHLLQVLCAVAMEPPRSLSGEDLRERRVELLRAVRKYAPEEAARRSTRARYAAGATAEGQHVPAYAEEEGVDAARETETFARLELLIDNERWRGVPFVLRTGKALASFRADITVFLKPASGAGRDTGPNELKLSFYPVRAELAVDAAGPGGLPEEFRGATLGADLPRADLPPYGRLLLGALSGDYAGVRADEAEEAWRVVEPFMDAWREGGTPLLEYPAGSDGPQPEPGRGRSGADGVQSGGEG